MKKLLLLLLLPVFGFGQNLVDIHYFTIENFGATQPNNFNDTVFKFERGDIYPNDPYDTRVEKLTVPDGKYWKIVHCQYFNKNSSSGYFRGRASTIANVPELIIYNRFFDPLKNETYSSSAPRYSTTKYDTTNPFFLSPGTIFTIGNMNIALIVVYEYIMGDNNSLSSNYPETIQNNSNSPVLFPNPTSSLLALNSDKEYDIEVYDMLGNKLMAVTGNSINMEHLSTATYIVKATDKSNNEELTYKVVKN
ncbi:MAG: T9SS type A sorting domain-containing protein [Jejuia sp.]